MSTPLMKQYARMKSKYPDTVLLFRLGDFYETFDEDAKITSRVLGITLTKRGNGTASEIPLAGFPHHALENHMPKFLRAGLKVAICEQMEDPKFAKGLVKREVTEVVTPGVAFSESVLDRKQNNYILAVALPNAISNRDETVGIAYADVTTAEFRVAEVPLGNLARHVATISPSEILVQKRDLDAIRSLLREHAGGIVTRVEDWVFGDDYSHEILLTHFRTRTLKGFGMGGMTIGIAAAGCVLHYLQETQKSNLDHLRGISALNLSSCMTLDSSTMRNLEITRTSGEDGGGSLFSVLDRTGTPMGGRRLKGWIGRPLRELGPIRERLDLVEQLVDSPELRSELSGVLSEIGDMERLTARICTGRATPREAAALAGMLEASDAVRELASGKGAGPLAVAAAPMAVFDRLVGTIRKTLTDDPPPTLAAGGVVRPGVDGELDELRDVALNGKSWIAGLQKTERERTGIASLKVGFNNVFGYYIEITNTHRDRVPPSYIRKQTLTSAERYITPELKEFEERILNAEEKILALETKIFNDLRSAIAAGAGDVQDSAGRIGTIDAALSLASVAAEYGYVKPDLDTGSEILIRGGRHPVIERLLPPDEVYTANDTRLDILTDQILIITGPNMSGKSSYLRQAGLIVLMAQIGSYVPARSAKIGIVDAIFTRVGASDNISSGESTFLVEMHEAANIVNTATERSLILLDEVGRGTSTFDGISIAWALTEHIHDRIGARTLFATHYHELNELASLHPRIRNLKVEVREHGNKVIFLHRVTPGSADHSYGIHVGRMAGLPPEVTDRAAQILKNLESSELLVHGGGTGKRKETGGPDRAGQMPLFEARDDELRNMIASIDTDRTTPMEALEKLIELKKHLSSG